MIEANKRLYASEIAGFSNISNCLHPLLALPLYIHRHIPPKKATSAALD